MRLTDAELAEGGRLWEAMLKLPDEDYSIDEYVSILKGWGDFARKNMPALLARPEEIARAAVREFAEAIVAHLESSIPCQDGTLASADFWDGKRTAFATVIRRLHGEAAARGVTLDDKP